jgi:hypothetical protein
MPAPFVPPGLDTNLGVRVNVSGASLQNQSGIGHDLAKLAALDELGVREVDGYRESWTEEESQAVRVLDVPWGNRFAFRDLMLGYTTNVAPPGAAPSTGGGVILGQPQGQFRRSLPAAHPEQPWLFASRVELMMGLGATVNNPNVFAQDIDGTLRLGPAGNQVFVPMIAYADTVNGLPGYGRYAVTYTARDYEVRSDAETLLQASGELSRYVSRFWTYSALMLPLGSLTSQLYFGGDAAKAATVIDPKDPAKARTVTLAGQNVPEAGAKIISMQQLTYVWHQVPDVPEDAIDACVGKVNGDWFDGAPGARRYAPGTLLCQPPLRERTPRSIVGRVSWTLTMKMDYRRAGWNFFPATDGNYYLAGFYNSQADAAAGKVPDRLVYEAADFNALFRAPAPVKYQ